MSTADGREVVFVDQGEFEGVRYVDVVTADGPWEYLVPLERAVVEHGDRPLKKNPGEL